MSLPATRTEVTEHPTSMGVTVAASGAELEADVQKKMKLWGVVEAFRDGRMPDNNQIDKVLAYTEKTAPMDVKKLSPEGRVMVDDVRDIIETMRMMVHEKNADELFQEAVWSSYGGDGNRAKQSGVAPVSKGDMKADANQAAAHLRVLITLFLTNSEARKLLGDFGIIGRDVFATAAERAARKVRPSDDQLNQVDQEAPSGQWVSSDGRTVGANETPEVHIKGPGGAEMRYNPKDAPGNAQLTDPNGNSRTAGEAYDQAQQKKEEVKSQAQSGANQASNYKEQAKDQARGHAQDLNSSRDPNASLSQQKDQVLGRANQKVDESDVDVGDAQGQANQAKAQAKDQARGTAEQLKNRIPEEHRRQAAHTVDATKEIVQDAFPEERRDQFIYRMKKVIVECQGHKDYNEAMTWILDTLENYQGHATHVAKKGVNAHQDLSSDPNVSDATNKFRLLLERFANGKSMDGMTNALDQIYSDVQQDQELRQWFHKLNDYAHRALLDQGWILDDESTKEANQLQESGKYFFGQDGKYKPHQEKLFDQIQLWFTAMGDDPLNIRFGEDWKRLTKDLLFDDAGSLTFKPKLWSDLRQVIIPTLIRQIGYIPIPRAEYSDDKIDLVIENLILSGPNLIPNVVELEAHNRFKFSPYSNINHTLDTHHHKFRLGLSQIQADIRDVAFAFRRKSGWPKLSDHGLADVVLAGNGISVDIELESVDNRRDSVFRVVHVKVNLDTFKFSIRDSKHDILYKFVKTVATGVIKKAIIAAISVAIRAGLEYADDELAEVRNTMADAKKRDDTNRTDELKNLYARKKQTAQDRASKADEKTGTFKIVTDRDSQLNPDLTHDSKKSIMQRAYKTSDMAASGNGWRSPAFDLLDENHPAVTGRHHPSAVPGAGHGNVNTSAIGQARGETQGAEGLGNRAGQPGSGLRGGESGAGTQAGNYGTSGQNYGTTGSNLGSTGGGNYGSATQSGAPGIAIQTGNYGTAGGNSGTVGQDTNYGTSGVMGANSYGTANQPTGYGGVNTAGGNAPGANLTSHYGLPAQAETYARTEESNVRRQL